MPKGKGGYWSGFGMMSSCSTKKQAAPQRNLSQINIKPSD
jgi:hypothetical protein